MDPLTDKVTRVLQPDGTTLEVRQPGALVQGSTNWRLTKDVFLRWKDHLEHAITNAEKTPPQESQFGIPKDMSPNTFARCLRDARQAVEQFGYDPALQHRYAALGPKFVFSLSPDGQSVWFRERGAPGRKPQGVAAMRTRSAPRVPEVVTPLPDESELRAICLLINSGRINGPFEFTGQVRQEFADEMETAYNLAFHYDSETNITRLL